MKKTLKQLELFLKGSNFDRGIRLGVAIAVPLGLLYLLDLINYAPAVVVGAFLNAPGDIPGSVKRKVNAILVSIGLTMLITALILFSKGFLPLLVIVLAAISFTISFLSVYGFRASMVSFSGLLAMVLAFAVQKDSPQEIYIHVGLMGLGGFWYLGISSIFQQLAPKKDQNQLLSDTLFLIGKYLKLRAKLLGNKSSRVENVKQVLVLQNLINEKHEILRESLFIARKRSGRSHYEEKQLLIFLSSIHIFELIEAKHLDYDMIDGIFGEQKKFLKASKNLNNKMGNHLIHLSELLIQKGEIPSEDVLTKALEKAKNSIGQYIDAVHLPSAREGALVLRNLYDYQKQLLQEIRAIRKVMANVKDAAKVSLKRQDAKQFLTLQEYRLNVLIQNFSLKSTMFRHSMRLAIALISAYLLGYLFNIQNAYWILLTIVVIMRPNYGLTRERSKDRIIGTLIGAAIAVPIVILSQNIVFYGVLAFVSLILAISLIQQNFKSAAALLTISIIFVYSLVNPNAFEVIQYRVIDTIIGAAIAVFTNYLVFPSWEADNLNQYLINALNKNRHYLLATRDLYLDRSSHKLTYNIARKEAFLAISNLNAAFQRFSQDPKSKQKEFQLIYEIVTLNQTMISAIASIGNFVSSHRITPASDEFNILIKRVASTLQICIESIEEPYSIEDQRQEMVDAAVKKLQGKYEALSSLRDEELRQGKTDLDEETLHGLQEAYLMVNHMSWLKSLSENLEKASQRYRANFLIANN